MLLECRLLLKCRLLKTKKNQRRKMRDCSLSPDQEGLPCERRVAESQRKQRWQMAFACTTNARQWRDCKIQLPSVSPWKDFRFVESRTYKNLIKCRCNLKPRPTMYSYMYMLLDVDVQVSSWHVHHRIIITHNIWHKDSRKRGKISWVRDSSETLSIHVSAILRTTSYNLLMPAYWTC